MMLFSCIPQGRFIFLWWVVCIRTLLGSETEGYLRKRSAYKWVCSYCIYIYKYIAASNACPLVRVVVCGFPLQPEPYSVVVNGVSPVTSLSVFLTPASQPAMWSLSTLIKLSVVPNSNQKDTTSMPDSLSAAAKTCALVCMCAWERQKLRGFILLFLFVVTFQL